MPILKLLERVSQKQPKKPHPFLSEQRTLKEAYLLGVAMQGLVDGSLDQPEKNYFFKLADAFQIEAGIAEALLNHASSADEALVKQICDTLGRTKFAYYFIVDLQIMAHQDDEVCERESKVIMHFANLLGIDDEDVAFLTDLADAVVTDDSAAKEQWVMTFFNSLKQHQGLEPGEFEHYTGE